MAWILAWFFLCVNSARFSLYKKSWHYSWQNSWHTFAMSDNSFMPPFFSCHIWNSFTPFFFTTCAIPFFHDQFFSCHFWARFVTTHCAVTNCFALVSSCHLPNPIYVRSTCQIVLILCLYTFVYICIILLMCWPGADSVLPEAIFGSPGLAHLHPHCSHDFW